MKLLTKELHESYENAKICYICKEKFENKYVKDKKYKVRDHCCYTVEYWGAAYSICNLKYNVPKKVPIAFLNGSNYNYHFIIKELAEELEKQLFYIAEKIEKYITFTVPIEKEVKSIDKNIEEVPKNISYRLQFKVGLLTIQKNFFFICFNDSPSKMMKNAFYFLLKALFVLKIF